MTPFQARLVAFAAVVAGLSVARAASAKPEFPRSIASHLNLSYTPVCSLCHDRASIGGSTVRTPFGLSMRAHGFTGKNNLVAALDALGAEHVDSDADGVDDVDELVDGTDPNSPAPDAVNGDPAYGCGAHVASGAPADAPGARWVGMLGVAMVIARRVRRRTRGDGAG